MASDLVLVQDLRTHFDGEKIAAARLHLTPVAGTFGLIGRGERREVDLVPASRFAVIALQQQGKICDRVFVLRHGHGPLMHVAEHSGARHVQAAANRPVKSNAGLGLFSHGINCIVDGAVCSSIAGMLHLFKTWWGADWNNPWNHARPIRGCTHEETPDLYRRAG